MQPPIDQVDTAGVIKPLVDFMASIRRRHWSTRAYLETGYLSAERLAPLFAPGPAPMRPASGPEAPGIYTRRL